MSRGPLEVLRQLRATYEGRGRFFPPVGEVDDAIAQVEALVRAVQGAATAYYDSDDAPNWKAIVNDLRVTVTPFTTGQDSEGVDGR